MDRAPVAGGGASTCPCGCAAPARRSPPAVGFGPFSTGAFYAVHDDGNVAAFSWTAIAGALGLRKDCMLPAR